MWFLIPRFVTDAFLPCAQPSTIPLNSSSDLRIGNFFRARDATDDKACFSQTATDQTEFAAPGYPLEEALGHFDARFDVFSVGVTLYKMATGELPDLRLERDALLATVGDPLKRVLVAFALHTDISDRPTAGELLQKLTTLAPASMMAEQYRAQVFVSMGGEEDGPIAEAKLLRDKLASQGVHLHIVSPHAGEDLDCLVYEMMTQCDAFIAMATKNVRVRVLTQHSFLESSSRAQYGADMGTIESHEVRTWQEQYQPKGKPLIPVRMVRAVIARGPNPSVLSILM